MVLKENYKNISRMHICFITSEFPKPGFPHGGVGTFIATLGKALLKKGVQVSVVGINNYTYIEEVSNEEGINVYRLKLKKVKGLTWCFNIQSINKKIKEIHQQNPIDIVEGTELGLAFLDKLPNIKYVIRMNGGHHFFAEAENRKTEWLKRILEKRSFKKADGILAVSVYVAETTRRLLKLGDVPITIIYNPIDSEKFYQSNPDLIQRHTILFAGSIVEKKGIRQLVQSLNYLIDEFPDVHLYIAGRDAFLPGTRIPYRPILEKEINDRIKSHITFLGVVPNSKMVTHIEKAEICCYPSHMEAMPLAWLEVLAMGKAFIGGSSGPGPEAVIDGKTGLLADPHNPESIADKIRFLFNNVDAGQELGKKARERIKREFTIEVVVLKNIEYYQSLINKQ